MINVSFGSIVEGGYLGTWPSRMARLGYIGDPTSLRAYSYRSNLSKLSGLLFTTVSRYQPATVLLETVSSVFGLTSGVYRWVYVIYEDIVNRNFLQPFERDFMTQASKLTGPKDWKLSWHAYYVGTVAVSGPARISCVFKAIEGGGPTTQNLQQSSVSLPSPSQ